jgi:hypothetical protein
MHLLRPLILLTALCLVGCSSAQNHETLMSAAGFRTLLPKTPTQIAQLQTIPQGRIIPVTKKGKTLFLYADAQHHALLIGNQQQYDTYEQYLSQYKIQKMKVEAATFNADDWNGWGGYGGGFWGPGFY